MEVRILGPLEVWENGRRLELGGGRQRALLAILTLHANEVVSSDRLIEALWEAPPPSAGKALQNLVSQLRKALGEAPNGAILTESPGYRLRLSDDSVDAWRFERLVAEGKRALDDDPARAARQLRDALALWRGPPLADFAYEGFAQVEIARLEELRLAALEDRIEADLATGSDAELVPELEALVAAHPLRERLRGGLMLALYRTGRQADALACYREVRALLRDELGLEPGGSLRELEQAILNQDPALGPPPRLPRPALRSRRRRLALGAAALLAVIAAAVAVAAVARDGTSPVVTPNSLVKIDAATNEIVDVLPVGRNPGDVAVVGRYVFVASEDDATLTRIDVGSGEVTTSGASGADAGLAGAGDRFVWTASLRRARVTRVNAESLLPIDGVPLASNMILAFVAVGGGSLWISQFSPPAVLRYRLRTLRLERRYSFGAFEVPIEVTYGHGAAWVGLARSNALLRIDAGTGRTRTTPVGRFVADLAVGFGSVWTVSAEKGTVWRIDAVSEEAEEIIGVGSAPFGVATGAGSVWVTNNCDGTVSRIDPGTDEVKATIETGFFPKWLAVGGGYVWVGIGGEAFEPCS